jgi:hypothetical protein
MTPRRGCAVSAACRALPNDLAVASDRVLDKIEMPLVPLDGEEPDFPVARTGRFPRGRGAPRLGRQLGL